MEGNEIVVAFAGTICAIFILLTYLNAIRKDCFMSQHRRSPQNNNLADGLTAAVIQSLPAFQFGEESRSDIGEDCAVCLGEFSAGEWMRLLPNCTHIFHALCIDAWFCSHSNCPLCRKDVLREFVDYSSFISVDMAPMIHQREGMSSQERQLGYHSEDDTNPVMPTTPHKTVENAINEESSSRDLETGLCTAC